ncbi:hypothetical protein [Parasitella parasitica]|uniref:Rap-GAP domain-containing protein n=1 Tax=Parasitella parasitica TaxID=35722 RepID=A0A0B7NNA7_9FUNG|nr:hypothetical protein [Parasitella parasitica]
MDLNNESTKRLSFSSRATKIPQKLAQSTFFSLKPTASTLMSPNSSSSSSSSSSDRLSTRISHMLFRQRTTSGSFVREESRSSSQSLDYGYNNNSIDTGRNYPSRSLDIPAHEVGQIYNRGSPKSNLITTTTAAWDNNQTQSSTSLSPYSISSPDRTDFSYYYSNGNNMSPDTAKDEINLFSPLSHSNSSVSSFADSVLTHHMTPPLSPMLPMIIKYDTFSTPTSAKITTKDFADALVKRCTQLIELLSTVDIGNTTTNTTTTAATTATTDTSAATGDKEAIHAEEMDSSRVKEMEASLRREKEQLTSQTLILIDACDESLCLQEARQKLENDDSCVSLETMKAFLVEVYNICITCLSLHYGAPALSYNDSQGFRKELPKIDTIGHNAKYYQELKADQIDPTANWFRQYFVGKRYHTYIGNLKQDVQQIETNPANAKKSKSKINSYFKGDDTLANDSLGIISVIQERAKEFSGPGNAAAAILGSQYRIIIRSKVSQQARYVLHECMAKETQTKLERANEGIKLDKCVPSPDKRSRSFMSKNNAASALETNESINTLTSRMLRAAILTVLPNIDLRSFKELSADSTIMSGLEQNLLAYDEIHIPRHYKFGLLTIRDDQTTEEAWLSNTGLSDDLQDFLDIMGEKVELKNYKGYSAGLDTKSGESGDYAYTSKWNDFDIIFHVAPLMPSQKNDKQQVLRKKHIGNDIVCIIFLEGNQLFDPTAIRSQFLHVFIIIRPEIVNDRQCWRIEILTKGNVPEFGPSIPSPPLFYDEEVLREFLTVKLINAENAALKSDKFFIPNSKARLGLLSTHIQTGLKYTPSQGSKPNNTDRLIGNKSSPYLPNTKQQQPQQPLQQPQQQQKKPPRPKSVNNKSPTNSIGSTASSIILREAILDEEKKANPTMTSADIPPLPSSSRSTLMHDWTKGFTKGEKTIPRKTSQLNISSTPMSTTSSLQQMESVGESDDSGSHIKKGTVDSHMEFNDKKKTHRHVYNAEQDEMYVGKDINISTESFLSTEQLFSAAEIMVESSTNYSTLPSSTTEEENSPSPDDRFGMKTFPPGSTTSSPNLMLSATAPTTPTTTTTTTSKSNGHVSSLAW